MKKLIDVNTERCIGCGACVRVCPSPEANTAKITDDGRIVIDINSDKCIACGECIKACNLHARDYEDDIDKFFKDLRERKIVVVVHPSIKTAFPGTWQAVLKWIKQNGVAGIYDAANGADICTWGYVRNFDSGTMKNVISQHCPAVVRYMELYHPDRAKSLAPIHSMFSCEAVYIRDYIKKNYAVAALTPCPAMSLEFEATNHVEYNITFKRLKEYFSRKKVDFSNITESDMHYDFDDQMQGCMGSIYPLPGGLRYNVTLNRPDIVAVSSDGVDRVYRELDAYAEQADQKNPQLFEALSCSGGCGCGCGVDDPEEISSLEVKNIMRQVEIEARSRRKTAINGNDRQFKVFDDRINPRSIVRNYNILGRPDPKTPLKDLEETFIMMGKPDSADRRINCGACGYKTCQQMAEAIYKGFNIPQNCIMCAREAAAAGGGAVISASELTGAGKAVEIAEKVSNFANTLTADIENIYASLFNIDDANQKSSSMSKIVVDILAKVVDFCSTVDSIDAENLPSLISTLRNLQNAVSTLNSNVADCAAGSSTIKEAMQEVADATTRLNAMANDMVSTLTG